MLNTPLRRELIEISWPERKPDLFEVLDGREILTFQGNPQRNADTRSQPDLQAGYVRRRDFYGNLRSDAAIECRFEKIRCGANGSDSICRQKRVVVRFGISAQPVRTRNDIRQLEVAVRV